MRTCETFQCRFLVTKSTRILGSCLLLLLALVLWNPSTPFIADGFVVPTILVTPRSATTSTINNQCMSNTGGGPHYSGYKHKSKFGGTVVCGSTLRQSAEKSSSSSSSSSSPDGRQQQKQKQTPPIEIVEIFDEDDDDVVVDFDDNINPETRLQNWMDDLQYLVQIASSDSTAVDQAESILDRMFETYVRTEDDTYRPTVDVYNLLLEINGYSRNPDGADKAEAILTMMEDPANESIARPNGGSYVEVMNAYAMRKNPEKVYAILDRQQKRYDGTNDEAVRPTIDGQNKLMKAYGIVGDVEKAESIFRSLLPNVDDGLVGSGNITMKADHKSWVQIMKAYVAIAMKESQRQRRYEAIEKVQSLLEEMQHTYEVTGEEDYRPRTDAYNALIRAVGTKHGREGAQEAKAILFDMMDRFQKNGEVDVKPDASTFRNVMAAYQGHRDTGSTAAKVQQLLQIQEGFLAAEKGSGKGSGNGTFDARTNYLAMTIISRSKDSKKAMRVKRIVDKFKHSAENGGKVRLSGPLYYNLLRACAYTDGTTEEKFEAFQIAAAAYKELLQLPEKELEPWSIMMFLKACSNLIPPNGKRDAVVKNIFKDCCKKGLVNDFVLAEFSRAASKSLQLEILGGFLEDDIRIPEDWGRNLKQQNAQDEKNKTVV